MERKDEIWIIGTEPPCPRCHHLNEMVHELLSELGLSVRVRHLAYTDDESRELAAKEGLEPGTAKNVAQKGGIQMDWQQIGALVNPGTPMKEEKNDDVCCPQVAQWTPELDQLLRPCEIEAKNLGIMMTPVLVLSGRIRHQGSVPLRDQIRTWLMETYRKGDTGSNGDPLTVEVFGPGCANCEKVYQNTFEAVARLGLDGRARIIKVTDIQTFGKRGINVTPALGIDGIIVSKGKVLGVQEIEKFLEKEGKVDG